MLSGRAFSGGQGYSTTHLSANDYYEKEKKVEGEWLGKACEMFGVSQGAQVYHAEFEAIRQNKHAQTGEQLTMRDNTIRKTNFLNRETGEIEEKMVSNRRNFYDFTLSAPKSFSVMAITMDDSRIKDWHAKAVLKTLEEMEKQTARQDHAKGGVERTGKLCAARYKHDANRALEPQLHDHVIVFNATPSMDGNNYAIESREFFDRCSYLTAVYRNELANQAITGGYNLEIDDYGAPQIKDCEDIVKVFSQRSKTIGELIEKAEGITGSTLKRAEKKRITFVSRGFDPVKFENLWTAHSKSLRNSKEDFLKKFTDLVRKSSDNSLAETTTDKVLNDQRSHLSETQRDKLVQFQREALLKSTKSVKGHVETLFKTVEKSFHFAMEHHFERKSVIKTHTLKETVIKAIMGKGLSTDTINREFFTELAENKLLEVNDETASREHWRMEKDIISWVEAGKSKFTPIDISNFRMTKELNASQKLAIFDMVTNRDQHQALIGKAGTGKTFTLSDVVKANHLDGVKVALCAPTNSARDVLRNYGDDLEKKYGNPIAAPAFKQAHSLQKILIDKKLQESLPSNSLVVVDEAGLISTRQLWELMQVANKRKWRLLQVGDPSQHYSVEAGDALRIQLKYSSIAKCSLEEVERQHERAMGGVYREVAKDLSNGNVKQALHKLDYTHAIIEVKDKLRYKAMANEFIKCSEKGKEVIIVNPTNRENELVSIEIRNQLKKKGDITEERKLTTFDSLGWTNAQKKTYGNYKEGMIIQVMNGKEKNSHWKVTRKVQGKGILSIGASGEERFFQKKDMANIDVFQKNELAIGKGDLILVRAGEKNPSGEIVNGEFLKVKGFDENDNILTEDGRKVTTRNITYGYASTSYRSQGSTKHTVLLGIDRHSVNHADKRLAYVAGTRGTDDIKIFCENKLDLMEIANRSGDRKSAMELMDQDYQKASKRAKYRARSLTEALNKCIWTILDISKHCLEVVASFRPGAQTKNFWPINPSNEQFLEDREQAIIQKQELQTSLDMDKEISITNIPSPPLKSMKMGRDQAISMNEKQVQNKSQGHRHSM